MLALRAGRHDGGIKMQQQSFNPPPLPPSRRRSLSGDRHSGEYLQRSGSGDSEVDALSPRSSSNYRYNNNQFAAPPKVPFRSQQPLRLASSGSSSNAIPRSAPTSNHRRTHSFDVPQRKLSRECSSNSLVSLVSPRSLSQSLRLLPDPRWGGGSGGTTNRARTMSGGSFDSGNGNTKVDSYSGEDRSLFLSGGNGSRQYGSMASTSKDVIMNGMNRSFTFEHVGSRHSRTTSEVSTTSFASALSVDRSVEPAKIDLAKSSIFKDVTSEGIVRLQLPKDNFRLLSDRDLESGYVYKRQLIDNEADYFQDFHTAEESTFFLNTTTGCHCLCDNCNHCHSRRKMLPPTYYVMSVKSDIFRRMFDEVLESKSMPCGLFFCGHHEDLRYPSIMIAVAIVFVVFVLFLAATVYFKD
ncbi:hypothetical protein HJC23_012437 [Cyclotella cryptica]|uniref:Uncharacterized protein n=1 Tax=Cyclotella cryptica TaxID=29204 RepID=A0ABD3Q2M6_9STRA